MSRAAAILLLAALSLTACDRTTPAASAPTGAKPAPTPGAPPAADPVEARYSPAYAQCLDSPEGQSTIGMIDCIGQELEVQDAALNSAYGKLSAAMNDRQRANLLAAQRAWIAFRDADCAARYDEDWGSLSRIEANGCVLRRTVERTLELERHPPLE